MVKGCGVLNKNLTFSANKQRKTSEIRRFRRFLVEISGIEPLTSWMPFIAADAAIGVTWGAERFFLVAQGLFDLVWSFGLLESLGLDSLNFLLCLFYHNQKKNTIFQTNTGAMVFRKITNRNTKGEHNEQVLYSLRSTSDRPKCRSTGSGSWNFKSQRIPTDAL